MIVGDDATPTTACPKSGAFMAEHVIEPQGPFSLAAARDFAGGFAAGIGGGATTGSGLVMAFPDEPTAVTGGPWGRSAAVELRQPARDGPVQARIQTDGDEQAALTQAVRCVSLDHDGPRLDRRRRARPGDP
jgi:hypothetical protein